VAASAVAELALWLVVGFVPSSPGPCHWVPPGRMALFEALRPRYGGVCALPDPYAS
ncbi:unnamed protein product, partial [Allacma fusca]